VFPEVLSGLLHCVRCSAILTFGAGVAHCASCGGSYPVSGGIVDLLPPAPAPSWAQLAMESRAVVAIYESRLWRRSPLFTIGAGISADHERSAVLDAAALTGDETVLDVACGPGFYTRPLAERAPRGRVVGLDLSRPMLQLAVRRTGREFLAHVAFVRTSALALPFDYDSFDRVNCCGALHLFSNPTRALAEMSHVLKPGGRLTLAVVRRRGGLSSRILRGLGVHSFTEQELASALCDVGLKQVEFHHARAFWMIASATTG
jgi:SAM-dependent methyltransferase